MLKVPALSKKTNDVLKALRQNGVDGKLSWSLINSVGWSKGSLDSLEEEKCGEIAKEAKLYISGEIGNYTVIYKKVEHVLHVVGDEITCSCEIPFPKTDLAHMLLFWIGKAWIENKKVVLSSSFLKSLLGRVTDENK